MSAHLDDALSALADGELSPTEDAAARAHVAECDACRAELAAIERVRALVRGLPMLDPPAVRLRRPSRVAGVAAAAVAAAASILFVTTASSPSEPGAPPVDRLVDVHATSGANGDPVTHLTPVVFAE